jgi:hypothetical protein
MQHVRAGSTLICICAVTLAAALATSPASPGFEQAQADESPAYVVEVTDVSAKVGEPAVLHPRCAFATAIGFSRVTTIA